MDQDLQFALLFNFEPHPNQHAQERRFSFALVAGVAGWLFFAMLGVVLMRCS